MAYKDINIRCLRDRERFRRRTATRIAAGLCPRCGQRPPEPGRRVCEPCGEKSRRAERAARNLCARCGKAPPEPDRRMCESCAAKRRASENARYAAGKAAGNGTWPVANLSIATDESYIDRQTGEKVDKTEWHRIVTFQDGLISMLVKYARKGRPVYIDGRFQTRRWSKPGEDGDRFSTEILLVPGGRVQFLDKPNGNGASAQAGQAAMGDAGAAGRAEPASPAADTDSEIPF